MAPTQLKCMSVCLRFPGQGPVFAFANFLASSLSFLFSASMCRRENINRWESKGLVKCVHRDGRGLVARSRAIGVNLTTHLHKTFSMLHFLGGLFTAFEFTG